MFDEKFWQDRRVLMTGHTGFKGAWLSLWLKELKANVTGYALDPATSPSLFEVAELQSSMRDVRGDIRDIQLLRKTLQETQPEIIFHLAAQSLVRPSYENPVETYESNVMGTVNLLEAARDTPSVKAIVVITSDKCYENREWIYGYRETEALGGHDPYSSSKACAEIVSSAYYRSFFASKDVGLATARAGNVIGGGDWAADRLVPDFFRARAENKTIKLRNPNAKRPWQHVLEPLSGYLLLAEKLTASPASYSGAYNFGPHDEDCCDVLSVMQNLSELSSQKIICEYDQAINPHEATLLKLDASKARQQLHWQPRWTLPQTLNQIVAWHDAFESGQEMKTFCLNQIKNYLNFNTTGVENESIQTDHAVSNV